MELGLALEKKLHSAAVNFLKNGKPDWDIPHTFAAVCWVRRLIEEEGGNERILVPAMYLHDIGYPKLKKGYDFEDLMKSKKNHDTVSAERAKRILKGLKFSASEISEITELIGHHYQKDRLDSLNAQLVLEADGLAKVDWRRVTPNFDKENCIKYLDYFKGRNVPKFKTKTGKKYLKILLKQAEHYWD